MLAAASGEFRVYISSNEDLVDEFKKEPTSDQEWQLEGRGTMNQGTIKRQVLVEGNQIAFEAGEQVEIESTQPNPQNPIYKYIIYSNRLQKRFQLSDDDVELGIEQAPVVPPASPPIYQPAVPPQTPPPRSPKNNKKIILIIVGVLVGLLAIGGIVLAVSKIAGSGGDTGEAKEYMQGGDQIQAELDTGFIDVRNSMEKAFRAVTDRASLTTAVEDSKTAMAGLTLKVDKAIAEYVKIEGLSGVEDYKEYAALEIEAGKVYKEMMATTDKLCDEVVGSGTDEQVIKATTTYRQDMEELTKKRDEANGAAQQLKKDKKL